MARKPPAFPSTINIFRGAPPPTGVVVYTGPGEKRISVSGGAFNPGTLTALPLVPLVAIYLPTGTDVRGQLQTGGPDYIQWAGLPTWYYRVDYVDDVADGFGNKFRVAWCRPGAAPTPLP